MLKIKIRIFVHFYRNKMDVKKSDKNWRLCGVGGLDGGPDEEEDEKEEEKKYEKLEEYLKKVTENTGEKRLLF